MKTKMKAKMKAKTKNKEKVIKKSNYQRQERGRGRTTAQQYLSQPTVFLPFPLIPAGCEVKVTKSRFATRLPLREVKEIVAKKMEMEM